MTLALRIVGFSAEPSTPRQALLSMRANDEIGNDAFHHLEEELDRLEIAVGSKPE
jgi:hypothetical protein